MKIPLRPLLAGAALVGTFCTAIPAHSQPTNQAQSIIELQNGKGYELPLKNVAPRIMAWWLDPAHQPRPAEFGGPLEEKIQLTPQQQQKEPSPFNLPAGIESIAPLHANNSLLVIGTREAVQEFGKTVAFLDQPVRQIEIETHVVPMSPDDIKAFGLPQLEQTGKQMETGPATRVGFYRFRGDLSALLAARGGVGPLSEIRLPRVLALNNLSASLNTSRSYPAPAELQNRVKALIPQNGVSAPLEVQTPLKITLTPTINNDDTVTMLVELMGQVQLGRKGAPDALKLAEPSTIKSIMNAKDGETIAIRSLSQSFTEAFLNREALKNIPMLGDIPNTGQLFPDKKSQATELVVFLTPRIVRRAQP